MPISARDRIRSLVDPHTFREFKSGSRTDLSRWRRPQREGVVTGTAKLAQHPIVLATFDFEFHGGTMSVAVGERITRAIEYATQQQLPLVVITATGGIRIQEGMPALLQMVKTTQAVKEFQGVGRPFIAVLCNPTTGGVYASFASLADILVAEPGALVGFAGPRVAEALLHQKLPADSHRAEAAYAHGTIDTIVPRTDLRNRLAQILSLTTIQSGTVSTPNQTDERKTNPRTASEILTLARHADRPTASDYIHCIFANFLELHGDRLHGDDPAVIGGLARFEDQSVVVIAQERGHDEERHHGRAGPEGYRKAERLVHLAEHLKLPIVTFVDTPGADPGYASERHGIANAIAGCLAALIQTPTPTISVIIGEGTSGGALALAATDQVLMMENATYSVISPEGASVILFGDMLHASETIEKTGNRIDNLLALGIIDQVVPEPPDGAHVQPDLAISAAKTALQSSLAQLLPLSESERLVKRRTRYRRAGLIARP